jgi:hypothetical protein
MTLNDEINNFRKTDLYKNNLVSAKKLKTIQQAINVRQEASRIMVNDPIHKLTNKYIEENKKQLSPTTLYYTNLTPVIEDFSKRNAYILYNLEQLKKEYIYLENRIATYQAIDEELPPRKTQ